MRIIDPIKNFFSDLKLPIRNVRKQAVAKKACLLISALSASITGVCLYFAGFSAASLCFGSLGLFCTVSALTLGIFTNTYANWKMKLARLVPINSPSKDIEKSNLRNEIISMLTTVSVSTIVEIKEKFNFLFSLRAYAEADKTFCEQKCKEFSDEYTKLSRQIKSAKDWDAPANAPLIRELMINSILLSDLIVAKIEQGLRKEQIEVNTESVLKRLNDQSMYSGIIDFFHMVNAHSSEGNDFLIFPSSRDSREEFTGLIKAYNWFIKDGLYQRHDDQDFNRQELKDRNLRPT